MLIINTIISFVFCGFFIVTKAQSMTDEQIDEFNNMTSILMEHFEPNETFIPMEHSTTTMPPATVAPTTTTMPPVKTTTTMKRPYNDPTRNNETSSKYLETTQDTNTSKLNETKNDTPSITMTSDYNTPHSSTLDENITSNPNTTIIDGDTSDEDESETVLSDPYLDDPEREPWEEIIMLAYEFNITLCPDMDTFYTSFKDIIGGIKGRWDLDSHLDEIISKVSKSSHPLATCMMKFYGELENVLLKTIEKRRLIKEDKFHEAKKGKEAAVKAPTVHVIGEKSFATRLKENLKGIVEFF